MKKYILALFLSFSMVALFAQQTAFTNTFIELKQSVIDFREDGIPYCVRNGVMVNPSPSELKVGDVFIDADGNARQVTSVQRDGDELFIDTVKPDLSLVINYVKIPEQTICFNEDNFLPETLAGGDRSSVNSIYPVSVGGSFGDSREFTKELSNKAKTATIKAKGKAEITGSVTISAELGRPKILWVKAKNGYVNSSLNYNVKIDGSIDVSAQNSNESEPQLLYGFGNSGSISAGLGLYFQPILDGKVVLTLPVKSEFAGFVSEECVLKPIIDPETPRITKNCNFSVTVSPSLEADGKFTAKFFVGSTIKLLGYDLACFEAGGGPYAHLNGKIGINGITYSTNTGTVVVPKDAITIAGTGELGVCAKVAGSVCDGKWGFEAVNKEYPFIKAGWDNSKGGWYWTSPFKTAYLPDGSCFLVDSRYRDRQDCLMLPYRCLVPVSGVMEDKTI